MSATGLKIFDTTVHKTNAWLNESPAGAGLAGQARGLPGHEGDPARTPRSAHGGRGGAARAYSSRCSSEASTTRAGIRATSPRESGTGRSSWSGSSGEFRGGERIDPERVARAVFTVLAKRVSEGEIEDVKHVLPAEVRDLWP